jgi:hypothetical protein
MITEEQLYKLSSALISAMPPNTQQAAYFLDIIYRGDSSMQNISYTVAILHAIADANIAQPIIEMGLSFDPAGFWDVVRSISESAVGEEFRMMDGRLLTEALIVNGKSVTFHDPDAYKENDNETE